MNKLLIHVIEGCDGTFSAYCTPNDSVFIGVSSITLESLYEEVLEAINLHYKKQGVLYSINDFVFTYE